MGLFTKTKPADDTATKTVAVALKNQGPAPSPTDRNLASVIERTRVTEKAVSMSERNVYTFIVRRDATKFDVRDAVKEIYKVTPDRVRIVNRAPAKRPSGSKNRLVKVPGQKKAYVYLKKGDTINLV